MAPGLSTPRDIMAHILDNSPKVLPSYTRLSESSRAIVRDCLAYDFNLKHILDAETPAASLSVLKELMFLDSKRAPEDDDSDASSPCLFITLASWFMELAGSMGSQSQEGSPYMTEERYQKIRTATDAILLIESEGKSELEVYNQMLAKRAKLCDLTFDANVPESKAVARFACLASGSEACDGRAVTEAFKALSKEDHEAMVRHLNQNGIEDKPCFALLDAPSFLNCARANDEIGLAQATQIILRVYKAASKDFRNSKNNVINILCSDLAKFAHDFVGSAKFQDVPFELKKNNDSEAVVIPKVWIPVSNVTVLKSLQTDALQLCSELTKQKMSEESFKGSIYKIYPELSYFGPSVTEQRDQTLCAMHCVLWLVSGNHEAFIRSQPPDRQLSRQSWAWIQDFWFAKRMKLTTPEALDAMLTFMAIHALGKVEEFREDFLKGYSRGMHDVALAAILEEQPEVVPSFHRLSNRYQRLIIDSLNVDFQFSQFLQGENTPANLVMVKEKLQPHGSEGLDFFCFRIFVQMCGKLGPKSLSGSLFMDEANFRRCQPGMKALQQLRIQDGADAYNEFILQRGSKAMSRFASPEHQALSRLLCLGEAYDTEDGRSLCDAFDELKEKERSSLARWLNGDGVKHPGYIMVYASLLLKNAKANASVGLVSALRMMIKVQRMLREAKVQDFPRVIVHLNKVAMWAKEAGSGDNGDFLQANLTCRKEAQGDWQVLFIDVIKPPDKSPAAETAEEEDEDLLEGPMTRMGTDVDLGSPVNGQQQVTPSVSFMMPSPPTVGPPANPSAPVTPDIRPGAAIGASSSSRSYPPVPAPQVVNETPETTPDTPAYREKPDEVTEGENCGGLVIRPRPAAIATLVLALPSLLFCLGSSEPIVISRQAFDLFLTALVILATAILLRCFDRRQSAGVHDEDMLSNASAWIFSEERGQRQPFLACDWIPLQSLRTSSREPQYSRLRTFDDGP